MEQIENEMRLTDLIPIETLQIIQDSFSKWQEWRLSPQTRTEFR